MEEDLKVAVKGVEEKRAHEMGNNVALAIKHLGASGNGLDLRRMHRIIVTSDLGGEIANLSIERGFEKSITHTNEEYAVALAQVNILPIGDDYEIVIIIDAHLAAALTHTELMNPYDLDVHDACHILHHELCHVHDNNKKIDALSKVMLNHVYTGKDKLTMPLTEVCWSEYIANYLSASSVSEGHLIGKNDSLLDSIYRAKQIVNEEILYYRYDGDLLKLIEMFERHGAFLPKTASLMLGYLDGLEITLNELDNDVSKSLSDSYFEPTWTAMRKALREMREKYPDGWEDISIYNELAIAIDNYCSDMGLVLSNTAEGELYVDVPFRPETTPSNPLIPVGIDWFKEK